MDALKYLTANIPDWLTRLDDLGGQIAQRQLELIQLAEKEKAIHQSSKSNDTETPHSVRNRGSAESLKPRNSPTPQRSPSPPLLEAPNKPLPALPAAAFAPVAPTRSPPPTPRTTAKDVIPAAPTRSPPPTPVTRQQSRGSTAQPNAAMSPSAISNIPSAVTRQTNQAHVAPQARARALSARKRQRTDSMASVELAGATPKYRTRSMIIVYYDSYVQSFFEDLVKFVSSSRNMMRKAKMAAKVAQIKRMAELDAPDDDDEDDQQDQGLQNELKDCQMGGTLPALKVSASAPATPAIMNGGPVLTLSPSPLPLSDAPLEAAPLDDCEDEDLPALRYVSTRRMHATSNRAATALLAATRRPPTSWTAGTGPQSSLAASSVAPPLPSPSTASRGWGDPAPTDIYDELDKGLEYVQSMCEHAAHQFLRDGDCGEEVGHIVRRFTETRTLADREIERARGEGEAANLTAGGVAAIDATSTAALGSPRRSFRPQSMRREHVDNTALLEADGILAADDEPVVRKLVYKSSRSRMMMAR